MLYLRKSLALAAILISSCAPTPEIHVNNNSNESIYYKVEYSNGTGVFDDNAVCAEAKGDLVAGFWLSSGQTKILKATNSNGIAFNGAITAVINNTFIGARNEIDYTNLTVPFFDVSYQYGITDGTCGPPNKSPLAGERDTLGKANTAWKTLNQTMKNHLLRFPRYLKQDDVNGSLTFINMTIDAWPARLDVINFFQATAGFKAYMGPGSVKDVTWSKNSTQQKVIDLADKQTMSTKTDTIIINSY